MCQCDRITPYYGWGRTWNNWVPKTFKNIYCWQKVSGDLVASNFIYQHSIDGKGRPVFRYKLSN